MLKGHTAIAARDCRCSGIRISYTASLISFRLVIVYTYRCQGVILTITVLRLLSFHDGDEGARPLAPIHHDDAGRRFTLRAVLAPRASMRAHINGLNTRRR